MITLPPQHPHLVSILKLALRVIACCILVTTTDGPAFAKGSFSVRPPQTWVRTINADANNAAQSPSSSSSTFLLDDHQVRVTEGSVERYYHHAQRVDTTAGLEDLSQLRFYFEPSYQKLTIHFIRIKRGDTTFDALKPREIKVIHYEQELDQQLYNGTLAAIVFLNDVRVGDVVDYSYTVTGENPVLGGRFADTFYLGDQQAIQHLTSRLVWPNNRSLAIKNTNIEMQPIVNQFGAETEYFWERHKTFPVTKEDAVPDWYDPYPSVSLSEFANWGDVVQWALPLYKVAGANSPDLNSRIQGWQAELTSPAQRAVAALRFVQDEVRYLGIELGRYSHQPTAPSKVLQRRFGDCKDKSMLLSTLLGSMGIDAAPALVNTSTGRSLDNLQPSPFAFDHVIVQAKIDGKTYWLDPTISYQRGGLDQYYDLPYERALVLRENSSNLEEIPRPSTGTGSILVNERYQAPFKGAPITLTVVTTYRGSEADQMRYQLAGSSLDALAKTYLNFYADENPSISATGPPQVKDDEITNTVIVTEEYIIDNFWKDGQHSFLADKIFGEIGKPNVSQRSMPLRIRSPRSIKQTIEIDLGLRYDIKDDRGSISDDALSFDYSVSKEGNLIRLDYSFKTLADHVPVNRVQQHLMLRDKINNLIGFELYDRFSGARLASDSTTTSIGLVLATGFVVLSLFIVLPIILFRRVSKSRRNAKFADKLRSHAGTTPETAIDVSDDRTLDAFLSDFQCNCGNRPYNHQNPPNRDRFTYDGKRLIGIRLRCAACGVTTDLYFALYSDAADQVAIVETEPYLDSPTPSSLEEDGLVKDRP